ncbi:MAG: LuxR C-terminal-related transcriptional regulator [Solirubrobacteraceae bacterium]
MQPEPAAVEQLEPVTLGLAPEREGRDWRAIALAVRGMGGARTVEQLFGLVPAELCRCGFSRAWLSRVDGTECRPASFHFSGALASRAGRLARTLEHLRPAPLAHGSHEAEIVRRRRAMLVLDAGDERCDPVIAELFTPSSYVAAPVVVETRVVAILHADRPRSPTAIDEYDRDLLEVFAEAAGQALQRVILGERLERLRSDVRALTNSVGDLVEERCYEPIGLPREDPTGIPREDPIGTSRSPNAAPPATGSRLAGLLTSRELEVLRLMATGETNAGIATQLVISQGTVKSHVKNVLRKLHAANRAQAVSRYFKLVGADSAR